MAIYGQQDAMRHEHRDQLQELVVVRGFGDEFDRHFYVKMMRGELRAPKGSKSAPVQLFMESAQTQQRVANAGSPNWAMVHMSGTGPKGPYVVLDYYPRSANEFVENKTPMSPRSLNRIVTGVVDGLIDLQRVADRPHGNLKPSNVLIGPGEVERAEVALADPAPLELLATQGRGDAYDLGQLIHCLVLQRRFTGNWPIEPSAGWTSLGSKAKGWRELCNRLLNPNPDKRPRLRQIRADLNKLQPGGSRVPRVAIGAALGTFVLAAGAAFYVYDPLDLRGNDGGSGVAAGPSTTRPVVASSSVTGTAPASPTTRIAAATAAAQDTSPVVQSPVLAAATSSQREVPAGQEETPAAVTTTTPETPAVELPAARVAQVREAQAAFASRGWTGAAQYLQELAARLAGPESKPQAADAAALESAAALATQIERDWGTVSKTQAALTVVDDRVVRSYAAAVAEATAAGKSEGSAESVSRLAEALNRLATDEDWGKVIAFVQSPQFKELDLVYFTRASDARRKFGDKQVASSEDLRAWLADASSGKYSTLNPEEDPRRDWKAAEQLERLRNAELPRLAKLAPATGDDPQLAGLQQQLQAVDARIAALQRHSWDRRQGDEVRNGVREVNETLAKLEAELKQAAAQRESEAVTAQARAREQAENAKRLAEVRTFVGGLGRTTVSAVGPIQKAWQDQVQSVAESLQKDPAQLGPQARTNVNELQQRLRAIDVAYRSLPAPAPPRADQPEWAQDLVKRINDAAAERRETFLTDALAAFRSQQTPEQSQAATKQLADAYGQWLDQSRGFLTDVSSLQSMLASGYMPDEKPDAKTPTAREVWARVQRHALWQEQRVRDAVAPLVQPLALADSNNWEELLGTAGRDDVPLGVRVAAWERLAASANAAWPADQEDVAQNFQVEEALRGAVKQQVTDGARLKQLTSRVEQPGRRNWQRFLARAASQPDVEFALRLKDRYVADVTTLDRRSQFNVLLHDLRRLMAEAEKDSSKQRAVHEQIVRIEQAIGALPADLGARQEVAALSGAIRGFRAAPGAAAAVNADKLAPMSLMPKGPGAIPWTYSYDPQTQTLTCVAELSQQLTTVPPEIVFKRVEGDARTPAFFLSTTEISVGVFRDLVRAAGKSADFERLLRGTDARGRDARVGPRSWTLAPWGSRTIFASTDTWFSDDRQDHYAPALSDSLNSTVLKDELGRRAPHLNPSNRHPMQYVPPQAAIEFAKLLGCRLQTPEEWRFAYGTNLTDRPNLRDQTWRIQYQWAADRRANQYLPDRGIFVPNNEAPSREVWTEAQLQGAARSATPGRAYSDGVLFFHEVAPNGGQSFNHLVGNVAEYAFAGDRLYVVGASALSPPPPARTVDQAYEVANWQDGKNEGYSDVGFRLAFPAPAAPFEQLRMVVEKQPYLTAAASPTTRPIAASE